MAEIGVDVRPGLSPEGEKEFLEALAKIRFLGDRQEVVRQVVRFRTGEEEAAPTTRRADLEQQARALMVQSAVFIYIQDILMQELERPRAVLREIAQIH